jgi:hypothetical protein
MAGRVGGDTPHSNPDTLCIHRKGGGREKKEERGGGGTWPHSVGGKMAERSVNG